MIHHPLWIRLGHIGIRQMLGTITERTLEDELNDVIS